MDRGAWGRLQSIGLQRVAHDWSDLAHTHTGKGWGGVESRRAPGGSFNQHSSASTHQAPLKPGTVLGTKDTAGPTETPLTPLMEFSFSLWMREEITEEIDFEG